MAKKTKLNWQGLSRQTTQVTPGVANNQLPEIVVTAASEEVMRAFLPIFKERLKRNIHDLNIGHEGDLDDSFKIATNKGSSKVTGSLKFNFYGRFVDMGVGKGTTLTERQTGRSLRDGRRGINTKRKPKPWFSPQYLHETQRLPEIMNNILADIATGAVSGLDVDVKLYL
jgi:hypothetical protein